MVSDIVLVFLRSFYTQYIFSDHECCEKKYRGYLQKMGREFINLGFSRPLWFTIIQNYSQRILTHYQNYLVFVKIFIQKCENCSHFSVKYFLGNLVLLIRSQNSLAGILNGGNQRGREKAQVDKFSREILETSSYKKYIFLYTTLYFCHEILTMLLDIP